MKLILVRHGETEANLQKIIQGQQPGELSAEGRLQARLLGERLRRERIDHFWASPLRRVVQTAAAVIHHHLIDIIPMPELMERHFGLLEGKGFEDYFLALEKSGLPFHLFRPPGGESLGDVEERLAYVVNRLHRIPQGETLVLAAHSVINKILLRILLHKGIEEWDAIRQDNGCVNILHRNEKSGAMEAELLNCTRHLQAREAVPVAARGGNLSSKTAP